MPDTSAFGHIKVFPFTLEKSAYLEADPDECGLPTFRFSGWASLAVPDSDGEVVDVGFFDARLSEFLANPVMRWMHGHGDVQGRYLDIKPVPGKGYWSEAIAIDFSGGTFNRSHGFGDAVFAAAAAVVDAIEGDCGIRQSGSGEADQGEEGQERVFHERE